MNSERPLQEYTLLAGVHNLLERAGLEWLHCLQHGCLPRPLDGQQHGCSTTVADANPWLLSDDDGCVGSKKKPQGASEPVTWGALADVEVTGEAQPADQAAEPTTQWAEYNRQQRAKAQKFIASQPLERLLMSTITLSLSVHILHVVERVAAEAWEIQQWAEQLQTGAANFRLKALLNDELSESVLEKGRALLADANCYSAVPSSLRTWRAAGLAFRMVSTSLCSMEHYMFMRWRQPPFAVFRLIGLSLEERPQVARELLNLPPCLCDGWTRRLLAKYTSVDDLLSKECLAFLCCLASLIKFEITETECKHASIRRLQLARSTAHLGDVAKTSADFVIRSAHKYLEHVGVDREVWFGRQLSKQQSAKRLRQPRRGGGGGARCLLSKRLREQKPKTRADFEACSVWGRPCRARVASQRRRRSMGAVASRG